MAIVGVHKMNGKKEERLDAKSDRQLNKNTDSLMKSLSVTGQESATEQYQRELRAQKNLNRLPRAASLLFGRPEIEDKGHVVVNGLDSSRANASTQKPDIRTLSNTPKHGAEHCGLQATELLTELLNRVKPDKGLHSVERILKRVTDQMAQHAMRDGWAPRHAHIERFHALHNRVVTFRNGEIEQIEHPNGQVWTRDPREANLWQVREPRAGHHGCYLEYEVSGEVEVDRHSRKVSWHPLPGHSKNHDNQHFAPTTKHDQNQSTLPKFDGRKGFTIQPHLPVQHGLPVKHETPPKHETPVKHEPVLGSSPTNDRVGFVPDQLLLMASDFAKRADVLQAVRAAHGTVIRTIGDGPTTVYLVRTDRGRMDSAFAALSNDKRVQGVQRNYISEPLPIEKPLAGKEPIAQPVEPKKPIVAPPVEREKPIVAPPVELEKPIVAPPVELEKPIVVPPPDSEERFVLPPVKMERPVVSVGPIQKIETDLSKIQSMSLVELRTYSPTELQSMNEQLNLLRSNLIVERNSAVKPLADQYDATTVQRDNDLAPLKQRYEASQALLSQQLLSVDQTRTAINNQFQQQLGSIDSEITNWTNNYENMLKQVDYRLDMNQKQLHSQADPLEERLAKLNAQLDAGFGKTPMITPGSNPDLWRMRFEERPQLEATLHGIRAYAEEQIQRDTAERLRIVNQYQGRLDQLTEQRNHTIIDHQSRIKSLDHLHENYVTQNRNAVDALESQMLSISTQAQRTLLNINANIQNASKPYDQKLLAIAETQQHVSSALAAKRVPSDPIAEQIKTINAKDLRDKYSSAELAKLSTDLYESRLNAIAEVNNVVDPLLDAREAVASELPAKLQSLIDQRTAVEMEMHKALQPIDGPRSMYQNNYNAQLDEVGEKLFKLNSQFEKELNDAEAKLRSLQSEWQQNGAPVEVRLRNEKLLADSLLHKEPIKLLGQDFNTLRDLQSNKIPQDDATVHAMHQRYDEPIRKAMEQRNDVIKRYSPQLETLQKKQVDIAKQYESQIQYYNTQHNSIVKTYSDKLQTIESQLKAVQTAHEARLAGIDAQITQIARPYENLISSIEKAQDNVQEVLAKTMPLSTPESSVSTALLETANKSSQDNPVSSVRSANSPEKLMVAVQELNKSEAVTGDSTFQLDTSALKNRVHDLNAQKSTATQHFKEQYIYILTGNPKTPIAESNRALEKLVQQADNGDAKATSVLKRLDTIERDADKDEAARQRQIDMYKELTNNVTKFESDPHITREQRESINKSLQKILNSDDPDQTTGLTLGERQDLAVGLIHNIANPGQSVQEDNGTCGEAAIENVLARNYPDVYAKLLADASTNGALTFDGTLVQVLSPGMIHADEGMRPRPLASKIMQGVLASTVAASRGASYVIDPRNGKEFEITQRVTYDNKGNEIAPGSKLEWRGTNAPEVSNLLTALTGKPHSFTQSDNATQEAFNRQLDDALKAGDGTVEILTSDNKHWVTVESENGSLKLHNSQFDGRTQAVTRQQLYDFLNDGKGGVSVFIVRADKPSTPSSSSPAQLTIPKSAGKGTGDIMGKSFVESQSSKLSSPSFNPPGGSYQVGHSPTADSKIEIFKQTRADWQPEKGDYVKYADTLVPPPPPPRPYFNPGNNNGQYDAPPEISPVDNGGGISYGVGSTVGEAPGKGVVTWTKEPIIRREVYGTVLPKK